MLDTIAYSFLYIFGGLECVGHSFAYVFLGDIRIRTQRAAVASRCAATHLSILATHLPTLPPISLLSHPSSILYWYTSMHMIQSETNKENEYLRHIWLLFVSNPI